MNSFFSPATPSLSLKNQVLYMDEVSIKDMAKQYGTPLYLYSQTTIDQSIQSFKTALQNYPNYLICYAVKANSNLHLLRYFAQQGCGFDIVSGGELQRVIKAGADPKTVVFSGIGKSTQEIELGLSHSILCFNVESLPELERIAQVAQHHGVKAPISLRVNPDVNPKTHPYISTGLRNNKFGIVREQAITAYLRAQELPNLTITGIDCHIGSQITEIQPFLDTIDRLADLLDELRKYQIEIEHFDLGGGLGVQYAETAPPSPVDLYHAVFSRLKTHGLSNKKFIIEPGRSLIAKAGVLLTKIEYLKETPFKQFAIVDAAMNDLIRPTLYDAYHGVLEVEKKNNVPTQTWDIVGPVCETGDWLAKERVLRIEAGDLLLIQSTGAYGFTMSSQYNTRGRCAEVLLNQGQTQLIRRRETFEDLIQAELFS